MTIAVLVVLGLSFGSFVNALVWRIHEQLDDESKKKSKKRNYDISITKGRSVCVHCKHELAAMDLVPVLSWIGLRGKCRYCNKSISWQYPLVELLTAALFVLSYLYWPEDLSGFEWFNLGFWQAYIVALVALVVYDLRWMLLPNRIVYPLIALSIVQSIANSINDGSWKAISTSFLGYIVFGGLFYLIYQVSSGKWIGGGDVKLSFFLGVLLGPVSSLISLFFASLAGSIITIGLMISGKISRADPIPFGPFLIAGAIFAMLFGADIADWYSDEFLNSSL